MSECQTKARNQECFEKLENLKTWKPENFENIKNDPWDMLNNFCFHLYAQKSLFIYSKIAMWFFGLLFSMSRVSE